MHFDEINILKPHKNKCFGKEINIRKQIIAMEGTYSKLE